jgi:hypothetical protein
MIQVSLNLEEIIYTVSALRATIKHYEAAMKAAADKGLGDFNEPYAIAIRAMQSALERLTSVQ